MLQRPPQQSRPCPQALASRPCDNCGSLSHKSRAQNCPAHGQMCHNCAKCNHFASVCRSAPAELPTIIHSVYSGPVSFKVCSVVLNDVCMPLLLDTRASASLLNSQTLRVFFFQSAATFTTLYFILWLWRLKDWPSGFHPCDCWVWQQVGTQLYVLCCLNPAVKPVIQPLCRIPLAFCDGVSAKPKQLLNAAIIEPVDALPWVSNLVV